MCTISTASHDLNDKDITDYAGNVSRLGFLRDYSPLVVSGELSEYVHKGVSTFVKVTFHGELGDVYRLSFLCKRSNNVQIGDELILNTQILNCSPGYQPSWTNLDNGAKSARICSYCEDRTFNLDGIQCKPCPEGGECRGGGSPRSHADHRRSRVLPEMAGSGAARSRVGPPLDPYEHLGSSALPRGRLSREQPEER